ncbi:hypothetical protein HDV00_010039 [Rhizophlyctis rosea]|nr:hypothetical protein HDV00_010039 [Rhizophlyctis rosea]
MSETVLLSKTPNNMRAVEKKSDRASSPNAGDRRYKCATCQQSFRRTEHLLRHRLTHSGERPYPCTICSRGFSRLDALQRHLRTHNGRSESDRSDSTSSTSSSSPPAIINADWSAQPTSARKPTTRPSSATKSFKPIARPSVATLTRSPSPIPLPISVPAYAPLSPPPTPALSFCDSDVPVTPTSPSASFSFPPPTHHTYSYFYASSYPEPMSPAHSYHYALPDSPPMMPTPRDDVPLMTLAFCAEARAEEEVEGGVRGRKRYLEEEERNERYYRSPSSAPVALPPTKRPAYRVRIEDLLN